MKRYLDSEFGVRMLDICHVCRKENSIIHIEGDADYCFKCFKKMLLDELGDKNVFEYSKYVTVREPNGTLHSFLVTHRMIGQMPAWEAVEQGGEYKFSNMSFANDNGTDVVCEFLDQVLRGISSKTLRYMDPNKLRARLADKGTVTVVESEDSLLEIGFVVDGEYFSGHEFVRLLAGYEGFNLRYQVHEPTEGTLLEDEYLVPTIITRELLTEEVREIIDKYTMKRYITTDLITKFEKDFAAAELKLKIFLNGEKRREAVAAGKEIVRMINRLESDSDQFPGKLIARLEKMIFPYGADERDFY